MQDYERRARELLGRRLDRPVGHLQALERLDAQTQAALRSAIEDAIRERRRQLDRALSRVLPGPLRLLALRGIER